MQVRSARCRSKCKCKCKCKGKGKGKGEWSPKRGCQGTGKWYLSFWARVWAPCLPASAGVSSEPPARLTGHPPSCRSAPGALASLGALVCPNRTWAPPCHPTPTCKTFSSVVLRGAAPGSLGPYLKLNLSAAKEAQAHEASSSLLARNAASTNTTLIWSATAAA